MIWNKKMSRIKKKIKKILPDRLLYLYSVIKYCPRYMWAIFTSKNCICENINFYSDRETVDKIIYEHKSLSRFGDGELSWMSGIKLDSFQDYSVEFAQHLKSAFQSENPNLLIGIPYGIKDASKCNLYAKMHWRIIKEEFYEKLIQFADLTKTYCNASITRPYIDYKDKEYSSQCFKNLRRIWEQRKVIFVEGEKTKLGVGNDLFDNTKSIKRIICPPKNAYARFDEIKQAILDNVDKEDLILAALGPTASILAAELCDMGYQIVDIGHVDIEYWWYQHRSILRDRVPGKYVNESGEKTCSDCYDKDKEYLESIIFHIK